MRITTVRARRLAAVVAVAGIAALGLAACTTTPSPESSSSSSGAASGGTVTTAEVNDFTSFNYNTPQGNLDTNGKVAYLTAGGFFTVDPEFNVVPDTSFGTIEKTSDDPLTVKYTLQPDLKWSDGEPITADDMVLAWAIASGYYDDGTTDEEGNVTTGTNYFGIAGSTAGLDTTAYPTVGDDGLTMTLVYSAPYVDYAIFSPLAQPSHIVAKKAGLDSAAALTELLAGLPEGDAESPVDPDPTLQAAAEFVNTGYDVTAMPTDADLLVSSGPMMVSDWVPTQSITLVKNPEYVGDHAMQIDKLVIRIIGDANAQVTALQNGEVDIVNPQASADTLKGLEAANATVMTGDQVSYDHLDLSFNADVFKDADVRKAFLLTVPRQQILDSIVTPLNPDAKVLDSLQFLPQQADYADSVSANGSSEFDAVDIDAAKALLKGATPTVKLMYNTENPNRVDEFAAIQASAAEAGFVVEDAGTPDWGSKLGDGTYDAVLFGWINPGYGYAGVPQIWSTDGGGNYNAYKGTNDEALSTQSLLDPAEIVPILKEMDAKAFADGYGLPLFQSPGILATNDRVSGVEFMGNQTGPYWNAWEWTVSK